MNQRVVMALLKEAASADCTWERRNRIQCDLSEACAAMRADGVYDVANPAAGLHLALGTLWVEAVQNNPQSLVGLFPFFAMIAGDRDPNSLVADIDWSLVE